MTENGAYVKLQGDIAVAMARVAMKRQRPEAQFDTDLARSMADAALAVIADEVRRQAEVGRFSSAHVGDLYSDLLLEVLQDDHAR